MAYNDGNMGHSSHSRPPADPNGFAVPLPPGKHDLEILEKLKEIIKSGQHEIYRAVPLPAALASHYLGPSTRPAEPAPISTLKEQAMVVDGGSSSSTRPSAAVRSPNDAAGSTKPPQKDVAPVATASRSNSVGVVSACLHTLLTTRS